MIDQDEVDAAVREVVAEHSFSGVVRIDVDGMHHESAHGWADRAHGIEMTPLTRIGVASCTKTFTALTVMALVERGAIDLTTRSRELLGDDLPLIDDRVTVEQLLSHRSGIGDYFDESAHGEITDYAMPVPVHQLATPADYLAVLDGHPQVFEPGSDFAYCNSGFVVLALLAERATGRSYFELVDELVVQPAGLTHTAFLRGDELPGDAAIGYLHADGLRSNVLHLPVRGGGDGGVSTTAADVHRLWQAIDEGRVVDPATWAVMTTPVTPVTHHWFAYGLGCWLHPASASVVMEGYDAGASFRAIHGPQRTWTVLSNTSEGAWPAAKWIAGVVGPTLGA